MQFNAGRAPGGGGQRMGGQYGGGPGAMNASGMMPSYTGMYGQRFGAKLSQQEQEIIDVAFHAFQNNDIDASGKGKITTDQLRQAFEDIDAMGDIHDIQLLIDDIDENGDGVINYDEFKHIMTRKFLGEDDDSSFVHAFEMLDVNKDGYIPLVEMRQILMREGLAPLSEQEVDELMMFADLDGDGLINYRSFLRWLANPDQGKG